MECGILTLWRQAVTILADCRCTYMASLLVMSYHIFSFISIDTEPGIGIKTHFWKPKQMYFNLPKIIFEIQVPFKAIKISTHGFVSNLTETDKTCKLWIYKFISGKIRTVFYKNCSRLFLRKAIVAAVIFTKPGLNLTRHWITWPRSIHYPTPLQTHFWE